MRLCLMGMGIPTLSPGATATKRTGRRQGRAAIISYSNLFVPGSRIGNPFDAIESADVRRVTVNIHRWIARGGVRGHVDPVGSSQIGRLLNDVGQTDIGGIAKLKTG